MFDVVLFQPEIPPNTGNIIRLCANTGCHLHLIEPLAFQIDDRSLRRAGLDYREIADIHTYRTWQHWLDGNSCKRIVALTTKGELRYDRFVFQCGDALLFGPETRGLPDEVLQELDPSHRLRLPMATRGRSLNLSNTVAITVYEAWRQTGFSGGS